MKLQPFLKCFAIAALCLAGSLPCARAQAGGDPRDTYITEGMKYPRFALKTDLLYDAATTISLGGEAALAPKWTLELGAGFNNWKFSHGKRWKNWFAQPEARYWFCDAWDGHFVGLHAMGGQYNMGGISGLPDVLGTPFSDLKDHRYQGWFVGAGVAYGYDWIINRHWNIEAEIGLGWAYTRYDKFNCVGCGRKLESDKPHNYFGPTKAAVSIVYVF